MSLYADICRDSYAMDDDIEYDEACKTWTVLSQRGMDYPLSGIPNKEMALAIVRALYATWDAGWEAGIDSSKYS